MIVDELAGLRGSRLLYVPALCSTLWSVHGVFVREWKIGELFFWYWCELVLGGISGVLLIYRWQRMQPTGSFKTAMKEAATTALVFLMIGFFATMFSAMAWAQDFKSVTAVPAYAVQHRMSLLLLACGFCAAHLIIAHRRRFVLIAKNDLLKPLTNKMWPILGLYFFLIMQYHLTGSTKLNITASYLQLMAAALLGSKMLVELRHLFLPPRSKPATAEVKTVHPQRETF